MHEETGTPIAAPPYRLVIAGVVIFWTLALAGSLWWNISHLREATLEAAHIQAHVAYKEDILFRQWNATHRGVYVPVTEASRPDPYLDVPKRDVTLPSGEALTLMNPHHMMRQVYELAEKESGVRGHLTSLKPLRPGNAPDAWEAEALRSFETGRSEEMISVELLGGQPYMRMIHPFRTEKPCLACHAAQGYKEGDIRGGISISIPMAPLWALEGKRQQALILAHGLLWAVGFGGIALVSQRLRRKEGEREAATAALQESETRFRAVAQSATDAIVSADQAGQIIFWNRGAQVIFGYQEDEILGKPLTVLMPLGYREAHRAGMERLRATEEPRVFSTRVELSGLRKDGSEFPLDLSLASWQIGKDTFYTAIIRDITERKRIEEALARRTRHLEAIRHVTEEITRELDLAVLLEIIARRAAELAGVSWSTVWLWDETKEILTPGASCGFGDWMAGRRLKLGEGLSGVVAQRREGLLVNDYRSCPYQLTTDLERVGITAMLAEPLLYRGRLLGVLRIAAGEGRQFSPEDQGLIALFAAQAAIAIENARLHEKAVRRTRQLARRTQQLEALLGASRSVMEGLDLTSTLNRIVAEASRIAGTEHVKILLVDKARESLRVVAAGGAGLSVGMEIPMGVGLSGIVAATGNALFVPDSDSNPKNPFREEDARAGIRAYLGLPIVLHDIILGVLTFNSSDPREYSTEEQAYLQVFADQAVLAIENARLHGEVQQHARELEARVRERTVELEEALRVKAEFLANMSHELRTPLNGILGFVELLLQPDPGLPREKQERFLRHILASGQRLLELVNQILDYTAAEADTLTLHCQPLSPATALEEALGRIRPLTTKKGQSLQTEIAPDLPLLHADPARFRQICFSLLTNAVKFTPEGGRITVAARRVREGRKQEAGSSEQQPEGALSIGSPLPPAACPLPIGDIGEPVADWLELTVSDTGNGIWPEDLPRLFQQFTQLESAYTKQHAGVGIGLALVKQLVELHGGTITASSEGEGKGSTFTVRLPVGKNQEAESRRQEAAKELRNAE